MASCSDRDDEFSSALVLRIIYTDEGYSVWKPWINDHNYGDCFTFYSAVVHNDVLIENNKYGYITIQNNGAMKIVNFTHAQTAETRRSFLHLWTPGTRLVLCVCDYSYITHTCTVVYMYMYPELASQS